MFNLKYTRNIVESGVKHQNLKYTRNIVESGVKHQNLKYIRSLTKAINVLMLMTV